MGNHRLYKIECLHMLGTPESERLKVTALNLFHQTASPPFQEVGLLILRHNRKAGIFQQFNREFLSSPFEVPGFLLEAISHWKMRIRQV